jgi:hypothetical protein
LKRIPQGLNGKEKQYHDGMPLHTYVLYWGILGTYVPQINMGNGDSHEVDVELENEGALDIHEDALVITYLQGGEILIGLTPKEHDRVVHRANQFRWEANCPLWVWIDGQVWVVFHLKECEGFV